MLAARQGTAAPAPPPIHYDDRIENAAEYVGRYETVGGDAFTLRADGTKLLLKSERNGEEVALSKAGEDAFMAPGSRFERALLVFKREEGKPAYAWWNDARFSKDPAGRKPTSTPPELAALAGLYVNNDPWADDFQVIAREDGLWLDGVEPLVLLSDGAYRVGKADWGCERVRFEAPLDGRPQRLIFSGVDHTRMAQEV